MIYGIDLGTTCSIIGYGDQLLTGLVDSSVDIEKGIEVPRTTVGPNVVSSYKVDMTLGVNGTQAVKASSIVLRHLADYVENKYGEVVQDVIISVPAAFTNIQRGAVIEAGKKAGLNVKALINEPTAAALFLADEPDLYLVYDLGGGTFDLTLIDTRYSKARVISTDGRLIAGDDLDKAILNNIYTGSKFKIMERTEKNKQLLLNKIREAKFAMQKTLCTQYIDLSEFGKSPYELTYEEYAETTKTVFAETLELVKRQLNTYVAYGVKPKLLFVGGSCNCPVLKDWIKESTGLPVYESNKSVAPDYTVAFGVSKYAEMYELGTNIDAFDDVTKRIAIEDSTGCMNTIIESNSIIPAEGTTPIYNAETNNRLNIKLYQGDGMVASDCTYIGNLSYDYGHEVEALTGLVVVTVRVDRNGIVSVTGEDILTGQKQNIKLEVNA